MQEIFKNKSALRALMKQKRETISPKDHSLWSRKICQNLEKTEFFQMAKNILFFAPLPVEPDIFPLADKNIDSRVQLPNTEVFFCVKNIIFPRVEGKNLACKKVTSIGQLREGNYGILEPPENLPNISPDQIDLVLLPALAIDKSGNRLGFGGGYYDRFLPLTSAKRIAVVFDFQMVDELPAEKHDEEVDMVITEESKM